MKQRITAEQLSELTTEQKEKLRELWVRDEGDYGVTEGIEFIVTGEREDEDTGFIFLIGKKPFYQGEIWFNCEKCLPLLSIGQMVELLGDRIIHINNMFIDGGWEANVLHGNKSYRAKELCDAFWITTIKEVL